MILKWHETFENMLDDGDPAEVTETQKRWNYLDGVKSASVLSTSATNAKHPDGRSKCVPIQIISVVLFSGEAMEIVMHEGAFLMSAETGTTLERLL